MPLIIPPEFMPIVDAAENATGPFDEFRYTGALASSLNARAIGPDERKGVVAEFDAWRFQRNPGRTWPMYWADLSSWGDEENRFHSPDVAEVDDEIILHWVSRSAQSPHPVARARFADLAWEIARFKSSTVRPTHDLAHRAIDEYISSVNKSLYMIEGQAWEWLDRALEISTAIRDGTRFLAAREAAFTLLRAVADEKDYLSIIRFENMMWTRRFKPVSAAERVEIVAALERELALRVDHTNPKTFDPHSARDAAEALARWRRQAGETADVARALTTAGEAFEQAAKMASPILAISWLEEQHVKYREAGMHEAAARVERTIRERGADAEKEMKLASVPIEIPKDEYEARIEAIVGDSVEQALRQIAAAGMMREHSIQEDVRTMLKSSVILPYIPIMMSGPGGFTTARVGSVKEDIDGHAMMHAGRLLGQFHSSVLNAAFARAREKHGFGIEPILAHLRACPFFIEEQMPLVRKGLEDWLEGDFVAAVHTLVPQIESAVRECLRQIGGSIWHFQRDVGGFMVNTMGALLTDSLFAERFPSDIRFHLRALYTDPRGLNVRNHMAHGLMHPSAFQRGLGNLVVHSMLLIAMTRLKPIAAPESEPQPPM